MNRCWRCGRHPTRVYGVPCASCRRVLEAEYDARNGGRLEFIPADFDCWGLFAIGSIDPEPQNTTYRRMKREEKRIGESKHAPLDWPAGSVEARGLATLQLLFGDL